MRKCTQEDIAKSLGISQATVALVVGNTHSPLRQRLSPETVRRVEEKARELGYTPHRGAQMLRTGRSNLIVLLNFGGYSEIGGLRAYHIGRLVHEAGFDFQTIDAYWWIGEAGHIVNQILALRPLGVIVTGSLQIPLPVDEFFAMGIPVVALGAEIPGVPLVRYDALAAIYEVTANAIAAGRRRLVLLARSAEDGKNWQMHERRHGFQKAIQAVGGSVRSYDDGETDFGFSADGDGVDAAIVSTRLRTAPFQGFEPAMEMTRRVLDAPVRPDMLICSNDRFAVGAATVCVRRQIAVPDAVGITGFDNLAYSTQGAVPLTTIEQPTERMCAAAVETLQQRIGKPVRLEEAPEEQVFPCEIIWRDSAQRHPVSLRETPTYLSNP